MRQAATYFQQGIDKDPKYAPAYAGLADALAPLSTWRYVPPQDFVAKARTNALRALQLDDTLAEAHSLLALIAEQYDYDWQTAEKECRRAIQLEPDRRDASTKRLRKADARGSSTRCRSSSPRTTA